MDWSRAKNVLICTFLLLNVVLGYQLWHDAQETAGPNLDFTSLDENTQRLMEEKSIQVLAPIPGDTPQLPKLSYTYVHSGEKDELVQLLRPVDSKLVFTHDALVEALEPQIQDIDNYQYDPLDVQEELVSGQADAFVLHPLVQGKWPLFNVKLALFYSNQKITGYRKIQVELQPSDEAKKMLPASKALARLIDGYLPRDSVVKDIRLGYYGQTFNSDSQVAAPVWRFMLDNGKGVYYVQMNGDVISPKTEHTEGS